MSTTIDIMGGLGNQLFQIFTLISYSIKSRKLFYFENKPITNGDRKKYYWDTPLLNKLKGFIKQPAQVQTQARAVIYREPFFHYTPIPHLNQNVKLFGYFQTEKYFQEHKELIFRIINLKNTQQQIKEKVAPYLPTTAFEKFVSLHFRVGDYAHQPQNHPLMPVEYYERALEQLLVDTGKNAWIVLYFCEENDIAYVTEKINYLKQNEKFKELIFIKVPSILDDWEQMILMSVCKHHIIANSTFSWWGAYFSGTEESPYYPTEWFGPRLADKKLNDFFPSGWKKV